MGFLTKRFPRSELLQILVLAGVQFSHILDFVLMMPLGPQLMRVFSIDVESFSLLVSVYTLAAAGSCFLASMVMDRFDRKKVLTAVYGGLVLGTFLCGVAPNFTLLILARIVTGIFGGLLQSIILSVLGDLVPVGRRGQATGMVLAAFAVASVVGVPLGLEIANRFGWNAPFLTLGVISLANLIFVHKLIPSQGVSPHPPGSTSHDNLWSLLKNSNTQVAAVLTICMMSTFAMFPFISPFLVQVVGVQESQLSQIYLTGGLASLVASPLLGRLADRFGAKLVFVLCSVFACGSVIGFSHIPYGSYHLAIILNMFIAVVGVGRMTPFMELINRSVTSQQRGSFMTLIAAVQQLSASGASYVGGLILGGGAGFQNFVVIGWVVALSIVVSIGLIFLFKPLSSQMAPT